LPTFNYKSPESSIRGFFINNRIVWKLYFHSKFKIKNKLSNIEISSKKNREDDIK